MCSSEKTDDEFRGNIITVGEPLGDFTKFRGNSDELAFSVGISSVCRQDLNYKYKHSSSSSFTPYLHPPSYNSDGISSSVPKKKGRLVGLGRRTRSVPPSSAPPPFVDPEVLTAQLKDKDDRISLLETQMAAQQAGYEAQRRLNQQMMEMMQRMYPNEFGIYRGTSSSEYTERHVPRNIPRNIFLGIYRSIDGYMAKNASIDELPRKYPDEVLTRYIPRRFLTN
ncbi:hypothetical protein DY000_02049009 [Brassica cretica]|uniref:Uncharacterized protein n=1 Tax=Brassica cretica TaxID=69181 RepID=A0ABQ7F389_BRACR|nr:hypothetical protein DY000_02049009 [Brassica cretica]